MRRFHPRYVSQGGESVQRLQLVRRIGCFILAGLWPCPDAGLFCESGTSLVTTVLARYSPSRHGRVSPGTDLFPTCERGVFWVVTPTTRVLFLQGGRRCRGPWCLLHGVLFGEVSDRYCSFFIVFLLCCICLACGLSWDRLVLVGPCL